MDTIFEIMDSMRAARSLLHLTQGKLAEKADVPRKIIMRIESGKGNVPPAMIEKVRLALMRLGVVFLSSTDEWTPPVALRKKKTGRTF